MSEIAERLDAVGAEGAAEPVARRAQGRGGRWVRAVGWRHVVAVLAVVFALYPIAWIVSASINPTGSLAGQRFIPENPTLLNYRGLLEGTTAGAEGGLFVKWFVNTMIVAGSAAIVITLLSALAAYAFSRMRFRGRRVGLLGLLLVQMFPALLAVVAVFLLLVNIGQVFDGRGILPNLGIGSRTGLILVYIGTGLGVNVWLMKGFFDTIPTSLDESARIDGASHTQVFFQIILPLVAPILAVVGLISFVFIQNDVILASVILKQPDDFTLAVGLFRFVSARYGARWGPFAAGAIMAGVPVVALWFALQRYIVSGLTTGSVKG